jgi:hypothetical protein
MEPDQRSWHISSGDSSFGSAQHVEHFRLPVGHYAVSRLNPEGPIGTFSCSSLPGGYCLVGLVHQGSGCRRTCSSVTVLPSRSGGSQESQSCMIKRTQTTLGPERFEDMLLGND